MSSCPSDIGQDRRGRQNCPSAVLRRSTLIPLEDRIPTFDKFDAAAAWDRLTPEQQREIGLLVVRFGTVGQCDEYYHETIEEARTGFMTSHWTEAALAQSVLPRDQIDRVAREAQQSFQALCDHFDPIWPQLFGWAGPE